jgi:hypothetical protein
MGKIQIWTGAKNIYWLPPFFGTKLELAPGAISFLDGAKVQELG